MFEKIEEQLGINKLNKYIEIKKQELEELKQLLHNKRDILERNTQFKIYDFMKVIQELINLCFNENYSYKVLISKKNKNTNNYYYVLTKITDINCESDEFWNEIEKDNIIILGSKSTKLEPTKISFITKKQDNLVKFNVNMNSLHLHTISSFMEEVIANKINGSFISLSNELNKYLNKNINRKTKKKV